MITLKTLDKASAQEVFDQVKTHLLAQNEKCMIGENCMYKLGNLKCAAGCLIAEDEYSGKMEGGDWISLITRKMVPDNHADLISQLQTVHDCIKVENWPEALKKVANKFNLIY